MDIQNEDINNREVNNNVQDLLWKLRERRDRLKLYSIKQETLKASRQAIKDREVERWGRESYFKMRKTWSWALIGFLGILILFQIFLTFLIGFEKINFTNYRWFLAGVITENFLQIIGLCYVVVKFLFPSSEK